MAVPLHRYTCSGVYEVTMNLLETRGVGYSYPTGIDAIHDISFEIKAGERVVILGPNGSGKSTLLKILNGLIFPSRGEVFAFGTPLTEETLKTGFNSIFRSRVGLLFQNPEVQLFSSSVWEEIAFGPVQLGISKDEVIRRVEDLLDLLRIKDLKDRAPHELSIGEKKKVAIASILSMNPDLLLLDEPTAGLDPRSTRELIDIIMDSHAGMKTFIIATHDLHMASEIGGRCIVLGEDGRIHREGDTEEILSDIEFLKRHNLIHIHRHRHNDIWHTHLHSHQIRTPGVDKNP